MTVKTSKYMGQCATAMLLVAALTRPAFAQQPTEKRIRELVAEAAKIVATGQVSTPTTAQQGGQTTAAGNGPMVHLSLDDAVKLALDRNLDIAVQRLNPAINDIAVASLQSSYKPSLTSTVSQAGQTTAPLSQLQLAQGGGGVESTTTTYNAGIAQSLRWGGGSYPFGLNNNRQSTNSNNAFYNPQYQSVWSGTLTQPLLRNFSIDGTRQQLQVTKLNREVSDIQLKQTITNTLSNVRSAYWDYVFAVQSVDVAKQALDLANKLVADNQTRVQVGTMAPIDVVQAQAQAATAQQNLVTAQAAVRTGELALKRLIVNGTADPNWTATIDPTDRPDFSPEPIDVEGAIRRALSERTDLEIAKKDVQMNDVTLKYLNDQTKPQADFIATYGLQGVGGPYLNRLNSGVLGSAVTETIPGGISDAFGTLFHNNYPRWTMQVNFSYPIGLSSQEAAVARARVQLNQVQSQLRQIELQVATDITNAGVNVRSNAERVQAAQASRELAQRQLDAENSKFAVGMSTNYFVVQFQNQLASAQNNELQAILNYRKSLVEFDRLQQTTLQTLGITVVNGAGGVGATSAATAQATGGNVQFGR